MRGCFGLLVLLFLTLGCGDDGTGGDSGASGNGDGDGDACSARLPARCEGDTRWADVEPIFQERCVSCHLGEANGPWALTSYSHASGWPEEITKVMEDCSMPPADAGVEMPIEEREKMLSWIRCGVRD